MNNDNISTDTSNETYTEETTTVVSDDKLDILHNDLQYTNNLLFWSICAVIVVSFVVFIYKILDFFD